MYTIKYFKIEIASLGNTSYYCFINFCPIFSRYHLDCWFTGFIILILNYIMKDFTWALTWHAILASGCFPSSSTWTSWSLNSRTGVCSNFASKASLPTTFFLLLQESKSKSWCAGATANEWRSIYFVEIVGLL